MTKHFGVNLLNKNNGFKLNFENYLKLNIKDITCYREELASKVENATTNMDLHLKVFKSLDWDRFNEELRKFLDSSNFNEIVDLNYVDTTRIFAYPCPECDFNYSVISGGLEDQLIRQFPPDYCLNNTYTAWLLEEILEAKERRKKAFESVLNDHEKGLQDEKAALGSSGSELNF